MRASKTRTVIVLSTLLLAAASGASAQEQAETAAASPVLTHDDVKRFIAEYDLSFSTRRPEAVMRFFADRVVAVLQDKASDGGGLTRFDRASLDQLWRDVLPHVDEYEQQRRREIVRVFDGGQRAEHRSLMFASARSGTKVISGWSEELITLELTGGVPKIVTIQAVELEGQ